MALSKKPDDTKCWWGYRTIGALHSLPVGMQNGAVTLENSLAVSHNTKYIALPCGPAATLLGIFTQMSRKHVHTKILLMNV